MLGFVVVSEIGKEGDLVGRAYDGKCAIVRPEGRPEGKEIRLGEVWFGILEPLKTFYFFKPLVRYY